MQSFMFVCDKTHKREVVQFPKIKEAGPLILPVNSKEILADCFTHKLKSVFEPTLLGAAFHLHPEFVSRSNRLKSRICTLIHNVTACKM